MDAGVGSADVLSIAEKVANEWSTVVIISGEVDVISDGTRFAKVANGSALLPRITGSGCLLSAVCGSFIAVQDDAFRASVEACASYAVASEYAEIELERKLPGSFRPLFLDALASWSVEKRVPKPKSKKVVNTNDFSTSINDSWFRFWRRRGDTSGYQDISRAQNLWHVRHHGNHGTKHARCKSSA